MSNNGINEAQVSVTPQLRSNYYRGGGKTQKSRSYPGIQQEIQPVPPISIAALSHAHLGGSSLASALPIIGNSYSRSLIPATQDSTLLKRNFNADDGLKSVTSDFFSSKWRVTEIARNLISCYHAQIRIHAIKNYIP